MKRFSCCSQSVAISCLRAKPAVEGGTTTCADTGCDRLKQLKRFIAVSAFVLAKTNSFVTVLFHFCFCFISIVRTV